MKAANIVTATVLAIGLALILGKLVSATSSRR